MALHRFSTNLTLVDSWANYHWRLTVSNSVGVATMTELTMLPAPGLTVAMSSNQFTLNWLDAPGCQLEYKTDLNSATWLTNGAPTLTNGINILAQPIDSKTKFFRLRKP